MATAPLAVQLYTFRAQLADDPEPVIARIAAMGFRGVEMVCAASMREEVRRSADGWALEGARIKRLLDEHGLVVCSAHTGLPEGPNAEALLDEQELLDNELLIVPALNVLAGASDDDLADPDTLKRIAERYNQAASRAASRGMRVGYHNHHWEWRAHADGRLAYDIFWERLDPSVVAEVDAYWAQLAGQDPVRVLSALGPRAQLVHVKDGPLVRDEPNTPVGAGALDVAAVLTAARHARWHVVELDSCATDLFDAVAGSVDWLVEQGHSSRREIEEAR